MKVSPTLELFILLTGLSITIPALYEDFSDEFKTGEWESWMKLSPHIIFTLAVSFGMIGHFKSSSGSLIFGWLLMLIGIFCTYFNAMFNTRSMSQVVCDEWSDICLEDSVGTCSSDYEAWQGLLYLLGLCCLIIGGSLTTLFFIERGQQIRKVAAS